MPFRRLKPLIPVLAGLGLFSSCAPVKHGAYLFPDYEGDGGKVVRRDCCGGAGPKEVLVVKGPHKIRYITVMRRSENGTNGFIGVYIPQGVQVAFAPPVILFESGKDGEGFEHPVTTISEAELRHLSPNCFNVIAGGLGADRRWETFPEVFTGKGKKGTAVWVDIHLLDATESGFRISLPGITVNGEPFGPIPVDFQPRGPNTYIYPMNC